MFYHSKTTCHESALLYLATKLVQQTLKCHHDKFGICRRIGHYVLNDRKAPVKRQASACSFNQAGTGRISGITYFINDFKIKGQALGNRFKWAEVIKYIDHEQDRDREAVSTSNDSTKAKYGEANPGAGQAVNERNRSGRGTGPADPDAGTNAAERNREREADDGGAGNNCVGE